jgi:hypothetical protein
MRVETGIVGAQWLGPEIVSVGGLHYLCILQMDEMER